MRLIGEQNKRRANYQKSTKTITYRKKKGNGEKGRGKRVKSWKKSFFLKKMFILLVLTFTLTCDLARGKASAIGCCGVEGGLLLEEPGIKHYEVKERNLYCKKLSEYRSNFGTPNELYIEKRLGERTMAYLLTESFPGRYNSLVIADVSKPSNPYVKSCLPLDDYLYSSMQVHRGFLYMVHTKSSGQDEIIIIDVRIAGTPKIATTLSLGYNSGIQIACRDDYLFVGNYNNSLIVFDITKPKKPEIAGQYQDASFCNWGGHFIFLKNDLLLYVNLTGYSEILDIRNIQKIQLKAAVGTVYGRYNTFLVGNEDYVGVLTNNKLSIINVTEPEQPEILEKEYAFSYNPNGAFISNNILYLSTEEQGIQCYNFTTPEQLRKLGDYLCEGARIRGSFITEEHLYFIDSQGLKIVETQGDPEKFQLQGSLYSGSGALKTFVEGTVAYLVNGKGGIEVLDISNSYKPKRLARISEVNNFYYDVIVHKNIAYVLDLKTCSLIRYDVKEPAKPVKLATNLKVEPFTYTNTKMLIEGERLYLLTNHHSISLSVSSTLTIVNISQVKKEPTKIAEYQFEGELTKRLEVKDKIIYLLKENRLEIFNATNGAEIKKIAYEGWEGARITAITRERNNLYVAFVEGRLEKVLLNVTKAPAELKTEKVYYLKTKNGKSLLESITYENSYIYMIDVQQGLMIYNLKKTYPEKIGEYYQISEKTAIERKVYGVNLKGLTVEDNIIYLAAELEGLILLHYNEAPIGKGMRQRMIIEAFAISTAIGSILVTIGLFKRKKTTTNKKGSRF